MAGHIAQVFSEPQRVLLSQEREEFAVVMPREPSPQRIISRIARRDRVPLESPVPRVQHPARGFDVGIQRSTLRGEARRIRGAARDCAWVMSRRR